MNSSIDNFYENKTWRFLVPCTRYYGEVFISKFNPVMKYAVGIHDMSFNENIDILNKKCIFILLDSITNKRYFEDFMFFVTYQNYYITDYWFDTDSVNPTKRMVVLELPERYHYTYDRFLDGEYSKMFSKQELEVLFGIEKREKEYNIMTFAEKSKKDFISILKNEFDYTEDYYHFFYDEESKKYINKELELPLKLKEEVFNVRENKRVFFRRDLDKNYQTI